MRLDNIDVLVSDVIANVNSEAGAIRDTLEAKADSVGYTMTESMNTIWNSANQVITNYGTNFLSSITGVQNAINDLTNLIKQAVDASNKKASASSSSTKPSSSTSTPKPATPTPTPKPATTSSGDGVPNVGDAVTFNSGAYYYSSDGISPTGTQMHGQTVYITKINNASWAKKKYHISKDKNAAHPLGWVDLSQISGYEKGIKSVPKDEMAVVGEHKKPETIVLDDGSILTPLSKNSSVFNNDAHENLWSFANDPQRFIESMIQNPPEVPNMFNEFTANQTNTVTINIPIENVSDYNDFVRQLQKDSKFEKMVQTMVLEPIAGNSTNLKYLDNLSIAGYDQITTMIVENCNTIDCADILRKSPKVNRARIIGINWELESVDLLEKLYKMGGIDKNGYNVDQSVVTGSQLTNDKGFITSYKDTTYKLGTPASATNGNATLDLTNNLDSSKQSIVVKGEGATKVTTDANGAIVITSSDTDTKYSHPNSGVGAGTYKSVTVNAQGHVTAGSNPTTLAGFGISDAYTKSQTDSKISSAVANAGHLKRSIVSALPEVAKADEHTIYMVAKAAGAVGSGDYNGYDEYMLVISGDTKKFEKIGDSAVDLTNYATKAYADQSEADALSAAKTYANGLAKNYATVAQGTKADSAVQSVKIGTTEYKSGTTVTLPAYPRKLNTELP